ncbi:MAG: 16S rRNA (adenine(1518)-N(6)/adenine(1519)-N(6))-dimethyltransferase RsmA [Verrucomicrobiota bacterium]|nr:16S rRNA (adenine(1518)-N(6)/adenine(1519)-N(6))-dimethyltransferase RsmA [Verrucomicrobiota bacterium]
MTLSEIDRTLRDIRVTPVKTLGQNFLHDQNLARWIVGHAEIEPGECVVEIGPGLGALTDLALAAGARVIAIEKDARLVEFLRKRFAGDSRLELIHRDALDFDLRPLFAHPRVKLLGNLPYYVASQLLLKFTADPSPISLWLLMLQKEMAQRLAAQPGTSAYGSLSLFVQLRYRVDYLRTIPPTVFLPNPEVDSALVRLTARVPGEFPPCDTELFTRLVRAGFSQRRKQLQKLLRPQIADWEEACERCGFGPKARAEDLPLSQWIALSNYVRNRRLEAAPADGDELFSVVDAEDRVVGSEARAAVHANNLLHRAVHILVFNPAGEVFLQKRSPWKDRHPSVWDSSAAGHVDAGEDYDDAAQRELREELGIEAKLQRIAKLPASSRTGQEFIWIYRAEHGGPFTLARDEIELGEFFAPAIVAHWIEARPDDFAPGFVESWKASLTSRR